MIFLVKLNGGEGVQKRCKMPDDGPNGWSKAETGAESRASVPSCHHCSRGSTEGTYSALAAVRTCCCYSTVHTQQLGLRSRGRRSRGSIPFILPARHEAGTYNSAIVYDCPRRCCWMDTKPTYASLMRALSNSGIAS